MNINQLTGIVIGAAIEVHKELGPGLLESAYEQCLCMELDQKNIPYRRQVAIPVYYKGTQLDCGYRADILIPDRLIIELKACEKLLPIHHAQILTYLKLARIKTGLLINFNVPVLKKGLKRFVT